MLKTSFNLIIKLFMKNPHPKSSELTTFENFSGNLESPDYWPIRRGLLRIRVPEWGDLRVWVRCCLEFLDGISFVFSSKYIINARVTM